MPSGSKQNESAEHNPRDESPSECPATGQVDDLDREAGHPRTRSRSAARLRDRARIVSLEAEVALLERERDLLADQIADLETDVEALEAELAEVEATGSRKDQNLQRVIDRYERIIDRKERAHRRRLDAAESVDPEPDQSVVDALKRVLDALSAPRR